MQHKKTSNILFAGYGKLASGIVNLLADQGCLFHGITRRPGTDSKVRIIPADLSATGSVKALLADDKLSAQPIDLVIVTFTPSAPGPDGYQKGYVDATANLMNILAAHSPNASVIYVSSTAVYPSYEAQGNDLDWIDENSPCTPVGWRAKALFAAENLVREESKDHCIVRLAGIYGASYRAIENTVLSPVDADKSNHTNRIHQTDCMRLIAHIARKFLAKDLLPRTVIGCDGEAKTLYEVQSWIRATIAELSPIPYTELRAILSRKREITPKNAAIRGKTGKKIRSATLTSPLDFQLQYPSFKAGYLPLIKQWVSEISSAE